MVSYSSIIHIFKISLYIYIYIYDMLIAFLIVLVISMQVTQQVYVVENWVWSATNSLNAEIQNRHDVEKALGVANHEKTQLVEKLKVTESARKSAEAGLKSAEA